MGGEFSKRAERKNLEKERKGEREGKKKASGAGGPLGISNRKRGSGWRKEKTRGTFHEGGGRGERRMSRDGANQMKGDDTKSLWKKDWSGKKGSG